MEPLPDPLKDRMLQQMKAPPHRPLSSNLFFTNFKKDRVNWKLLKLHLFEEGKIFKADLIVLICEVNKILKNEGNIIHVEDPLVLVGDIHGQFYDLLKMFEVGGNPENTKYLFLGDYVDRGVFSIEVLILLYSLKLTFPETFFLIRGNHECIQMSSYFNFRDECLNKFDQEIYDIFMDSFEYLPIAYLINGKFLGLHGGISPELKTIEDIKNLNRFKQPPKFGLYCDILWSDPIPEESGKMESIFKVNDVRGCSFFFGFDAIKHFLDKNDLISLIRAHEAQYDGYKMHRWNSKDPFPPVITIFSAPNYCDTYGNKGAILKFNNSLLNIQQFNAVHHPYVLPEFMNVFTWSLPFLFEKVKNIFNELTKTEAQKEIDLSESFIGRVAETMFEKQSIVSSKSLTSEKKKSEIIKKKILSISKMLKISKTIKENESDISKLKENIIENKLPFGILREGKEKFKEEIERFNRVKREDEKNERRPTFMPRMSKSVGVNPKKLMI